MFLQFLDRRDQLRNGCTDIGQFDDVGFRRLGESSELGERVAQIMDEGGLVSDEIVIALIDEQLEVQLSLIHI